MSVENKLPAEKLRTNSLLGVASLSHLIASDQIGDLMKLSCMLCLSGIHRYL